MFVNADLVKIQQVLYNLVDNAVKYSAIGGSVPDDAFYFMPDAVVG